MIHWLSFPGFGIGPFKVDSVAFSVFGREIAWYALIICAGMILAFFYSKNRAKIYGIVEDDFYDLVIFMIPIGIIGARLYFVLRKPELYKSFYDVIAIWNGGLGIYGGIIAGFLTVLVVSRIKKMKFLRILDAVSPGVMIGQLIGRWGNFMNAEAHGTETDLPWRMGISDTGDITHFYHPTFLYESLWNLIGFLLIHFLIQKKKRKDGYIFCFYIGWYGFGRTFIELLRTDSLYINIFGNDYRISSLVGIFSVFAAVILYFILRSKPCDLESGAYYAQRVNKGDDKFAPASESGSTLFSEDVRDGGAASGPEDGTESADEDAKAPENAEEQKEQEEQTERSGGKDGENDGDEAAR